MNEPMSPRDRIDDLLMRGEQAFEAGRVDEAEACFREALEADPRSLRALNDLGVVDFQRGDLAAAARHFAGALAIDPLDHSTLVNTTELLLASGQIGRAHV